MSKWLLFFGFMFVCSGFLMPIGAIMIAWYFVTNLLKNSTISVKQEQKIQEMKMDDYSKESLEEMR
jgi:purine-cytosine permease-like protein|tara:strand:- start:191 stop:388 length:198 start_codon:yes stop_codon:yes gene_type:complete